MDNALCEKLYRAYYMEVYSYLVSLTHSRARAEEITEDTFYKVMTSDASFRGEANPVTWLCAIAKNLYFDSLRRDAHFADAPPDGVIPSPEAEIVEKDTSLRIHVALHGLPEPYREVFELRVFGELSFAEVAKIFSKTESWARVTYHRARLQIQERMEKS